jgi:DUF1680 family protein
MMNIQDMRVTSGFWYEKQKLAAQKTLWEQYHILNGERNDISPDHFSPAIENFHIAAGELDLPYRGTVCNDSEVGKWIEAVAYSLKHFSDPELEKVADDLIDLICRTQMVDGYLNTYFQVLYPNERFKHFGFNCELYNMGHLMEGAAAYMECTHKDHFLKAMCKLADLLCDTIGPNEGQIHAYDGHAEIELGLLALYRVTKEQRYLDLAEYFVRERGKQPSFLLDEKPLHDTDPSIDDKWFGVSHHQAHMRVVDQQKADGHAVKVTYLFGAVEDLIQNRRDSDHKLINASDSVWNNMTTRRMYITGAIGSQGYAERFTVDDDLPSDHGYAETCASVGIAMWGRKMLSRAHRSDVVDIMEKAMLNGMLVGWSLDGNAYNYTNVLHCKRSVMQYRQDQQYLSLQRKPWFECACCPSNVLRVVCNIENYLFSATENTLYIDSYASAEIKATHDGVDFSLITETGYPYDGKCTVKINSPADLSASIALRIPGWCMRYQIKINDEIILSESDNGYLILKRIWHNGDTVTLSMDMPVQYQASASRIWDTAGKIAMVRGPLVYCVESSDNASLSDLFYDPNGAWELIQGSDILKNVFLIRCDAWQQTETLTPYIKLPVNFTKTKLTAIPYSVWGNRNSSDMDVWLPYRM